MHHAHCGSIVFFSLAHNDAWSWSARSVRCSSAARSFVRSFARSSVLMLLIRLLMMTTRSSSSEQETTDGNQNEKASESKVVAKPTTLCQHCNASSSQAPHVKSTDFHRSKFGPKVNPSTSPGGWRPQLAPRPPTGMAPRPSVGPRHASISELRQDSSRCVLQLLISQIKEFFYGLQYTTMRSDVQKKNI